MGHHFLSSAMLVLALFTSAWGNVLAAAFCPRGAGRECCFAKTSNYSKTSFHEDMAMNHMHMDSMSMAEINMDDIAMDAPTMDRMAVNEMRIDAATVAVFVPLSPPASSEESMANQFDQPVNSCAHCLGHSGTVNAPFSFVSGSHQARKEINSVPGPVAKFHCRSASVLAQIGLPKEHAPPGTRASRHILISVFLI